MKKIKNIVILFAVAIGLSSCADEFIETEPTTAVSPDALITDIASARGAVNGLYDRVQQTYVTAGYNAFLTGLFADELSHVGSFPSLAEYASNDIDLNNIENTRYWTDHFETINAANIIIDKLQEVEIDSEASAELTAQAKAVRAFMYYRLVKVYGGVPLALTGNLSATDIDTNPLPRSSESAIYDQIMLDLGDALADIRTSGSLYFFNENSVRVLKALVEMELEMYTQAEATLAPVIGEYTLATSYADLFGGNASTQEGVFAINFADFDGNSYAFYYLESGGRYEVAPSGDLLSSFEAGDERTSQIIGENPQIFKFKDPGSGSDDVYIFRYAHVLLMQAELLARRGDATASDYINMVRNRAGLGDVVLDSSNFIDLIAHERFVEFYGEDTDRLFTLTRLGIADQEISSKDNNTFIPERNNLWPIPQQEIERNSAITEADQNAGY